jgi:hypothetical protein
LIDFQMLRTGIYDLSQIQQGASLSDCYGLPRPISLTLYDQVQTLDNAQELGERILLNSTNARGAYKRTYSDRFESFDVRIIELLQNDFPTNRPLHVHDLGISDGRTACDYFQKVAAIYPQIEYWGSDFDSRVHVYEHGNYRLTISEQGVPLELVAPPFVFCLVRPVSWKRYPLHRLAQAYNCKRITELLRDSVTHPERSRIISLFGFPALQLAEKHSNFHLLNYNILDRFWQRDYLHVVRAMNVLNRSYFSDTERPQILRNIHDSLTSEGLLISGSNQEAGSPVNGGVYRKTVRGFEFAESFGSGHQWHDEILSWTAE